MGAVTGAMTYGQNKLKDVMESVLPSRMRSAHYDKQDIKQKNRRVINRQLARIDNTDTYLDDSRVGNLNYYPNKDIHYLVLDRRGADNVSALMQWAEFRVKKEGITDPHDRYDFVKRLMPDNLIGRHALTHVAQVNGFCDGTDEGFGSDCEIHGAPRYARYFNHAERRLREMEREKDNYVRFFSELIEKPGMHKQLNAALKKAHTPGHRKIVPGTLYMLNGRYAHEYDEYTCSGCTQPRMLYGTSDVESWVVDMFFPGTKEFVVYRSRGAYGSVWYDYVERHNEWKTAALRFMGRME